MPLNRFERKILLAIAAVALVPLLGALVLGRAALREVYELGVNAQVRQALENALSVYREQLLAQRKSGELAADLIAEDRCLAAALADQGSTETPEDHRPLDAARLQPCLERAMHRHPLVGKLAVVDHDSGHRVEHRNPGRLDARTMRTLELGRALEASPFRLEVTVATETARFEQYQAIGQLVDTYGRLQAGTDYLSRTYLLVYILSLLSVILVALAVGIGVSRRVTRRVAMVAAATRQVGRGDLQVEVPTDATDEIGELTRAFNQMVRDLRDSRVRIEYLQRIGAWQQFARRLAHEIKNPLTPIQLAMQEVHRTYSGDDARYRRNLEDALAIVTEEVATLRRLVGEFSTFAKLPEAQLSRADLNDFLEDALRGLRAALVEHAQNGPSPLAIRLDTQLDPNPLPVEIDAMMLRRCLDNLVRNAAQAMALAGASQGRIRLRTRQQAPHAVLEVEDDGPGVPEEARERIFDPYQTTKPEGTGLGLAIVKKVVLEHGGDIRCEPAEPAGARFVIELPLV